ncbi:UPF0280 family protein [Syntrophomonas palmitatica]|uniref:UPF0280 family protein n=1 Tax=Syntrophomonas palmitatica TaxID=402877 RepID=UPI0006D1C9B4|nr:UPF0280 family protein [Syntrophomonas palmitatica]
MNINNYVDRDYRLLHGSKDLKYFNIKVKESDLAIGVDADACNDSLVSLCLRELKRLRSELEYYIEMHPEFKTSFVPIELFPTAPEIARIMGTAALLAGVGPMAAVAGAIAQQIGQMLTQYSREVIVENGGDIYLRSYHERVIAVFAGQSKFSNHIGIKVNPGGQALGICTSSGTVGPSISLGTADAVLIKAGSAALADAAASRAGNQVKTGKDLLKAIEAAQEIAGIMGILVIKDEQMAAWGDIEIVPIVVK